MGRRKIEMKMVKDTSSRQVTFSKRRTGLFKKANELAILCGSELAILVFSPGGKPFSFGHPTVDAVADRFCQRHEPAPDAGGSSSSKVEKLNKQLESLMNQLQVEKKKGEMLDKALNEKKMIKSELAIDELEELQKLKGSLEKLRDDMKLYMREMEASSSLLLLAQEPVPGKKETRKRVAKIA